LSVETPTSRVSSAPPAAREQSGDGWVVFAGIILAIVGTLNFIGGIAAVGDSKFFVGDTKYVLGDLHTWGWVVLIIGAVQVLTAFGVWARNPFARGLGIAFASLNAIAQLLMLPAYPLWSLALFSMDIMIVYGLAAYGGRERS
jgi:hypothetical protein